MHGIGAQSALAIKRQRKRRDEQNKRNRARRGSHASFNVQTQDPPIQPNQVLGTITIGHIGITFLLIGILLVSTGFFPGNEKEMAELIGTGLICLGLGIFLTFLDRVFGTKEEKEITRYVEAKLGRTKSGQRITKDLSDISINPDQHTPSNSKHHNKGGGTPQPQIVIQMDDE